MPVRARDGSHALPYPPSHLRHRVGDLRATEDEVAAYEAVGRSSYERIVRSLPSGWEPRGKRVLDFGCGAGRTLRHFLDSDQAAELYGCDIDAPSLAWLTAQAGDAINVFQVSDGPRIPVADAYFDLVYAVSVFTHLSQHWAGWLLELHRVLAPAGLLFVTFLGPESGQRLMSEAWQEDCIGMLVLGEGAPWDQGGPFVVHSEWWIREHWGRAFDVLSLDHSALDMGDGFRQGTVLMAKRPVDMTVEELERPDPANANELRALASQQKIVLRHTASLRAALENRIAEQAEALRIVHSSRSWRLTAPLRGWAQRWRAHRSHASRGS